MRRFALWAGLVGATALAFLYWRSRGSGAAGDALEEIAVNARRLLDPPTEQSTNVLEEILVSAKRTVANVIGGGLPSGTRGIRNNNPGNIRKSRDTWVGLAPIQDDPEFFKFIEPKFGVRAIGVLLKNYRSKYGLQTVRDIINRWAPAIGQRPDGTRYTQDSSAYVAHVARILNVRPDEPLDVNARLGDLALAIIVHENGKNPYTVADINAWVRM